MAVCMFGGVFEILYDTKRSGNMGPEHWYLLRSPQYMPVALCFEEDPGLAAASWGEPARCSARSVIDSVWL